MTMMQEAGMINRARRIVLWIAMLLIILLTIFSIYGAFIGAERSKIFFNSLPMLIYWLAFGLLLVIGIVFFRKLLTSPASFATHFGCILILAGGFWGSQAVVDFRNARLNSGLIRSGEMVIYEGKTLQTVVTGRGQGKELPFAVKLTDFKIVYYPQGRLNVQTQQRMRFSFPAEPGKKYDLAGQGSVEVVRQFNNFKMLLENGIKNAVDDPNGKPNPALELRIINPDGSEKTKYVFEHFAGHPDTSGLLFTYRRTIKDFISDLEIIKHNKVIARKSIEVNKPLHYGGYLFYQQGYDSDSGQYTVLGVTSDTGLFTVHLGFFLLCTGLFWNMWLSRLLTQNSKLKTQNYGN